MKTEEEEQVRHLLSKQNHQRSRHQQENRRQLIGPALEAPQQGSFTHTVVIISQGVSFTLQEPKSPTAHRSGTLKGTFRYTWAHTVTGWRAIP